MKYVIVNTERESVYNPAPYLASFNLKNSIYPSKSWSHILDEAIVFDSEKNAKNIINLLRVNTPDMMQIREIKDDGYIPFKIGDLTLVLNNKVQLFFKSSKKYYPARIICHDRKGIINSAGKPAPIVALVEHPTDGEILFEATINGEAYSAEQGCHQALYIKYRNNE